MRSLSIWVLVGLAAAAAAGCGKRERHFKQGGTTAMAGEGGTAKVADGSERPEAEPGVMDKKGPAPAPAERAGAATASKGVLSAKSREAKGPEALVASGPKARK
jgi:hypothetical protein